VTELNFKGKEFVYNHHLAVPFRPLIPHAEKGIGPVSLDGNLIIHGDNLHALKALLPIYAGKVDCIFIDPPYNTGNEGWCYNDNVNAPMIKEWLASNPIGIEDGLRHDKWCAMMWPRLRLLHELLSQQGSIWITLNDIEASRIRAMLDEIFGADNFIASVVWQKKQSPQSDAINISDMHDYVIIYAKQAKKTKKDKDGWQRRLVAISDGQSANYGNPDGDERGFWTDADYTCAKTADEGPNLYYPIINPNSGEEVWPERTRVWAYDPDSHTKNVREGLLWWPVSRKKPRIKVFLKEGEEEGAVPGTWWPRTLGGDNQEAKQELLEIMQRVAENFQTPKPVRLVEKILQIATKPDAIVLDSFAGSGTTAHAVLDANLRDNGDRRFIFVEMEEYADTLTAERVRRAINGYDFTGTQGTELLREKITWTKFKKAERLIEQVEKIENLHAHEYDRIKKELKDGDLIVTGEKTIAERAEGLGGSFTYCTLGAPLELDSLLLGDTLPPYAGIGAVLFSMATNRAFDPAGMREADFYLGQTEGQHIWLFYKPDLDWLKSPEAALTLTRAKAISETDPEKRHLVFAPARFVSQKMLTEQKIQVEFVPLPDALYRIDRS
jgi:adenine-specific DNA-methyltransferase